MSLEGLIMSFNTFKALIQNIQELLLTNISMKNQRNNEDLECLQFGICSIQTKSPRPEELFFR